jgi:hypothetical protein
MEETTRLAASEKRREAAELFVRAGNTDDIDQRIDLLFQSRELLQEILVKYPQSDLTEKVQNNLARIDEELRSIDPSLLSATGAGGPPGEEAEQQGSLPEEWQNNTQQMQMVPEGNPSGIGEDERPVGTAAE